MSDDKYATFKQEVWQDHLYAIKPVFEAAHARLLVPKPLEDTVVIRKQDIFAASGLSAYANAMVAAAESLDVLLVETPGWSLPTERQIEVTAALRRISDYFFEEAGEARHWPHRKVPD